jgi:hypothetical protein
VKCGYVQFNREQCLLRVAASRTTTKQRTVKVSSIVDVICRYALEDGLDQDALRGVVQLASVKTLLDQTTITTLIKNLYPAQRVPEDVIITVVGALGQGKGKPSPGTQDSLVKWLTTVHEIIESPTVLSRLYGVLFGMLDMISIRCVAQARRQTPVELTLAGHLCVICCPPLLAESTSNHSGYSSCTYDLQVREWCLRSIH